MSDTTTRVPQANEKVMRVSLGWGLASVEIGDGDNMIALSFSGGTPESLTQDLIRLAHKHGCTTVHVSPSDHPGGVAEALRFAGLSVKVQR